MTFGYRATTVSSHDVTDLELKTALAASSDLVNSDERAGGLD